MRQRPWQQGVLMEIGPLGTGFVEDPDGQCYGFVAAMVEGPRTGIREGAPVNFRVDEAGCVAAVRLAA